MTVRTPIGHLRTTKANALERGRAHSSAVECLLCKEDALGSNPSGSIAGGDRNRVPYMGHGSTIESERDRCTAPCKRGWEGLMHTPFRNGCADDAVCTCDSDVHWIRLPGHSDKSNISVATVPAGGWLGSSADEGRAKLR